MKGVGNELMTKPDGSRKELFDKWRAGDLEAGGKLFCHYLDGLWVVIVKTLYNDVETADDIVQDTWVTITEKLDTIWYNDDNSFKVFLYKIAMNKVRDHLRRRKPKYSNAFNNDLENAISPNPDPLASAVKQDTERLVTKALQNLTEREREVLIKSICEDKSSQQIADYLGISLSTYFRSKDEAMEKITAIIKSGRIPMIENKKDELSELASLFADIQTCADALLLPDKSIVYLFFVADLGISDIAETLELSTATVNRVIENVTAQFIRVSPSLRRLLIRAYMPGRPDAGPCADYEGQNTSESIGKTCLFDVLCEKALSAGPQFRDIVKTALHISAPPVPAQLSTRLLSMVSLDHGRHGELKNSGNLQNNDIGKSQIVSDLTESNGYTDHRAQPVEKFPLTIREENFFLGKQRTAAGIEISPEVKTTSDGNVQVGCESEKVDVRFRIEVYKPLSGEYVITFQNLPDWAMPVSFSFTALQMDNLLKDYELQSYFRNGQLYVKVQSEEEELAFLNRKEVYIGFIISKVSEK